MKKLDALIHQLREAVNRMDEILKEEKTTITRDAALKRFEFTFDIAWKALRAFLSDQKGIDCNSPKDCIREAHRQGVIEYNEIWIEMPDWRNAIVHEYSEAYAEMLYEKLPSIFQLFKALSEKFERLR